MKILKQYPLLMLFAAFLLTVSVTDMFVNRRAFSEMENRYLAQRPPFRLSELLKNEYTPKYEKYVNDQFVGRDGWITVKSVSESALGKIENNGIVYGRENRMFDDYRTLDERRLEMNREFIGAFVEKYKDVSAITFALVPNSYAVLGDALPAGMHNIDQRARIAEIYAGLPTGAAALDLFPVMERAVADVNAGRGGSYPDDPVYYRTDHHWTSWGAYSACRAFAQSRGLQAADWETLVPLAHEVPGFFGTYYSKCKLFSAVPDVIAWYDIPFRSMTVGGEEKDSLYDASLWERRDKHKAFLWGNNDLTVIRSENNRNHTQGKTSRVLLVKDSYGNSLAPFLTYSYDEVYVADPRFLSGKMSALMSEVPFDDVLLLYNFMSFASDSNVGLLTY